MPWALFDFAWSVFRAKAVGRPFGALKKNVVELKYHQIANFQESIFELAAFMWAAKARKHLQLTSAGNLAADSVFSWYGRDTWLPQRCAVIPLW